MESICLSWTQEPTKCWLCGFDLVIECVKHVYPEERSVWYLSQTLSSKGWSPKWREKGYLWSSRLNGTFLSSSQCFVVVSWCSELVVLCIGTFSLMGHWNNGMKWNGKYVEYYSVCGALPRHLKLVVLISTPYPHMHTQDQLDTVLQHFWVFLTKCPTLPMAFWSIGLVYFPFFVQLFLDVTMASHDSANSSSCRILYCLFKSFHKALS